MAIPTVPYGGANARDVINELVAVANTDVPAKASQTAVDALATQVAAKASDQRVADLEAFAATRASQVTADTLAGYIATKASQAQADGLAAQMTSLSSQMAAKASAVRLESAFDLIYQRATRTELAALNAVVLGKADLSAMNDSVTSVLAQLYASLSPGAAARPGDHPKAFGSTLAGSGLTLAPSPGLVVTNADGWALRVTGAAMVARRQDDAIEPGRVYAVRWSTRRFADPSDPAGDSLTYGLAWLDAGKALISKTKAWEGVHSSFEGRLTRQVTLSLDMAADIVAPANARYVRPYVETYGSDGRVDVQVVDIWATSGLPGPKGDTGDVTPAAQAAATAATAAAITAQEIVASGRYIFPSRAMAMMAAPEAAPGAVQTLGYYQQGDGGDAMYRLVEAEPAHGGKFSMTLAGGAVVWYALVNRRTVRAKQLGAVGDGVTDDTAAIQRAVDYVGALADGGVVHLEAYRYRVTATIVVIGNQTTVKGDGRFDCQIYLDAHDFTIFYVEAEYRFVLREIGVQGFAESTETTEVYVVYGARNIDGVVRHVFLHTVNSGIWLDGPKTEFVDVYAGSLKQSVGVGLRMSDSSMETRKLHSIIVEASAGAVPAYGVRCTGGNNIDMADVQCWWMLTGISLVATNDNIFSVWMSRCHGDNCTYAGIELGGVGGNTLLRVKMEGCWTCDTKTASGLIVGDGVAGLEIVNHTSCHNAQHGYIVHAGAQNVRITGGSFAGNGGHGGLVLAGASGFVLTAGIYGPCDMWGGNAGWGVLIEDGASDHYIVNLPLCAGNDDGPLHDGGTGLHKHVQFVA